MGEVLNMMNVVYITDDGYVMQTCVSICSLAYNKQPDEKVKVYVICCGVSEMARNSILKCMCDGLYIEILDVENEYGELLKNIQNQLKISRKVNATVTALLKFYIVNILVDLDKVLYLDGDVLIQKSIDELYKWDIKDVYMAAVDDMGHNGRMIIQIKKKYNLQHYVNTGVLLLNLKKMREDDLCQKLVSYRITQNDNFMDQDAINAVVADKCNILPIKYNYLAFDYQKDNLIECVGGFYLNKYSSMRECVEDMSIVHLVRKPWKYYHPIYTELFIDYYDRSPYASEKLEIVYKIPYYMFDKESRIIIYAAGAQGNECYYSLKQSEYGNVVLWVDSNYEDKSDCVSSPYEILNYEFDFILIAVESREVIDEIRSFLIEELKVDKEKIMHIFM